jgi:hypothetical protein
MFDEQETTTGFKNPAHFLKRVLDRGNAAYSPRRHHGVDGVVVNGNSFGSAFDELRGAGVRSPFLRIICSSLGEGSMPIISLTLLP